LRPLVSEVQAQALKMCLERILPPARERPLFVQITAGLDCRRSCRLRDACSRRGGVWRDIGRRGNRREDFGARSGRRASVYHNPPCRTSRNTLAMIRNAGIEPTIIEYLKTPLTREILVDLITRMRLPVRE